MPRHKPIEDIHEFPLGVMHYRNQKTVITVMVRSSTVDTFWRTLAVATLDPDKVSRKYWVFQVLKVHVEVKDSTFQLTVPFATLSAATRALAHDIYDLNNSQEVSAMRCYQRMAGAGIRRRHMANIDIGRKDDDVNSDNDDTSVPDGDD